MDLIKKLSILADAAKYDASCASSGTDRRDSLNGKGIGSTEGAICHAYAPDGRCISLLKILMTNACAFDCLYCVNRASSNVPRARFSVKEVVDLTLDFYRRNYIEGLFLSSGIIRSPDYTMEQVVAVARSLRIDHDFRGYIHLKTIPDASEDLMAEAGLYADRLSINIEMPSEEGLQALAPEKDVRAIRKSMGRMRSRIEEAKAEKKAPKFSPAGQSTQMIVGADATDDRTILETSTNLYGAYKLKRVYYSAFSPIPQSPKSVPAAPPPLLREHRLYQADFLLRGYGFTAGELMPTSGNLALDVDPKLAWALSNREHFPMDLNRADAGMIARVPGIGLRNAKRLVDLRRLRRIRWEDLSRLRCSLKKLAPFVVTADYKPAHGAADSSILRRHLADHQPMTQQMNLWPELQAA